MKLSRRWWVLIGLVGILILLFVLHLIFLTQYQIVNPEYWELVELFNIDSEISLATWWSSTVLLFVPAVLLFIVGLIKRQTGEKLSWGWFLASAVFLFLSIDDAAMIHEKLSTINRLTGLQDVLNDIHPHLFGYSWWVIYVPIALIVMILLIRWFWSLPTRTKLFIVGAIALVVVGQLGMEMISGMRDSISNEYAGAEWRGLQKFTGRLGLTLFLFAIIDYMASNSIIRRRVGQLLGSNATDRN